MSNEVDSTNSPSIQPLFDFNAEHNGVKCIESLRPEERGTENQFWWTIVGFVSVFDESERTIRNNVNSLIEDEEVSEKNFRDASILDLNGVPHKTTIYNLEVLNKLGMCCFRGNKRAKAIRDKFNDVLVKHETGIVQPATPQTYLEALKALVASEEAKQAALAQRDEAIRTKAHFVEGRDAEMCGRNGGLTKSNNLLRNKNSALQTQIDTLREGWWSVSDMARAVRRSGALLRDYSDNALKDKCRYGLRHYATHLGKPSRMLNIDSTHTLSDGSVVQNKAEFFDEEVANMFLQWVKANPEKFPSIMTTLCFIDDDRDE